MRGARRQHHGRHTQNRIIPADAGSTPVKIVYNVMEEDHPRGCGEHFRGLLVD